MDRLFLGPKHEHGYYLGGAGWIWVPQQASEFNPPEQRVTFASEDKLFTAAGRGNLLTM